MTDLAERLLRDVLAEDADRAPLPRDLTGPARRRLRHRRVRTAGVAATVVAAAVTSLVVAWPGGVDRTGLVGPPPPDPNVLVGPTWILDEYVHDGARVTLSGDDLSLSMQLDGQFWASGCDSVDGGYTATATHLTLRIEVTTDTVCSPGVVDLGFAALARDPLAWSVEGRRLRLMGANGDVMEFHPLLPPYPYSDVADMALDDGDRNGWAYHVVAVKDTLHLVARKTFVESWVNLSLRKPAAGDPTGGEIHTQVADAVLVTGWMPDDATRATYTAPGAASVELPVVSRGRYKVFSGFVPAWSDAAAITLYRADGSVVTTWE